MSDEVPCMAVAGPSTSLDAFLAGLQAVAGALFSGEDTVPMPRRNVTWRDYFLTAARVGADLLERYGHLFPGLDICPGTVHEDVRRLQKLLAARAAAAELV